MRKNIRGITDFSRIHSLDFNIFIIIIFVFFLILMGRVYDYIYFILEFLFLFFLLPYFSIIKFM